jgi:hypothetical protein
MIKSKLCSICSSWEKKKERNQINFDVPAHNCMKNFEGKSGAMEPVAAAEMLILLHEKFHINFDIICMDDDASTRRALRWNNADWLANHPNETKLPQVLIKTGKNAGKYKDQPDTGKLQRYIKEPSIRSDPNHRRKQLTGELYDLLSKGVQEKQTMTKMDVKRLGKNFGYMARSLPKLQPEQYCLTAKAVLEHHFDNHMHCGEWCRRRLMSPEQQAASERYYRSKTKDAELYKTLSSIVDKYITQTRLEEIAHGMDTNANESINNTISY